MSIDPAKTLQRLNKIARAISDAYPDLTVLVIDAKAHEREEKLKAKSSLILEHPAGERLLEGVENTIIPPILMAKGEKQALPFLSKKPSFLAIHFVDIQQLENNTIWMFPDNLKNSISFNVYREIWPVLSLFIAFKAAKKEAFIPINKYVAQHKQDRLHNIRENLLADAFAIGLLEFSGDRGSASHLLKRRAELTTQTVKHNKPEYAPFPLTCDGIRLTIRHVRQDSSAFTKIEKAIEVAQETNEFYTDLHLEKWFDFVHKMQEMLWAKSTLREAIGAAAYSTEDTHIRSYASMLGDILNSDIAPIKITGNYNPFGNQETQETLHIKTARNQFDILFEKLKKTEDPQLFLSAIKKNNDRLLKGKVMGWCSPAIAEAHMMFLHMQNGEETNRFASTLDAFEKNLGKVTWDHIQALSGTIMHTNRHEDEPSLEKLKERLTGHETLSYLSEYF